MTTITFVVPVRNEEEYIHTSLQSLVEQSHPHSACEIIVVDGRSSDRTREIIKEIQEKYPHVRCLDNPAGIVPTAMNIGIRAARGEVILRADGHTIYPRDYAENCVKWLEKTGADNVGGPCVTVAADESIGARLVAAILSSPFGVGNSKFRTSNEEGYVDTVPFGAFRREIFDRVGLYNERLVRNQDTDLNARIRKAGGQIYLTPALTTHYHPVKTFSGLLKYAFKTNRWHFFTMRENRDSLRVRHLAPAVFLITLLSYLAASFASRVALWVSVAVLCAYFVAGFYFSLRPKMHHDWRVALLQPFATFCFHVAYGAGTLFGLPHLFGQPPSKPIRPGLQIHQKETQMARSSGYARTKRLLDIILAAAGLTVLAPVLVLLAIAVRVSSPGAALYRGVRTGLNGKLFRILKFRSMVASAELLGESCTSNNDARITPFGRWLRKYKLDELPQLINVLTGDMSLVGPRPEVPKITELFTDEEKQILSVRPGITDWASLCYSDEGAILAQSRDPERTYLEWIRPEKSRLQLKYVNERSLRVDAQIILSTCGLVLARCLGNKDWGNRIIRHSLGENSRWSESACPRQTLQDRR